MSDSQKAGGENGDCGLFARPWHRSQALVNSRNSDSRAASCGWRRPASASSRARRRVSTRACACGPCCSWLLISSSTARKGEDVARNWRWNYMRKEGGELGVM